MSENIQGTRYLATKPQNSVRGKERGWGRVSQALHSILTLVTPANSSPTSIGRTPPGGSGYILGFSLE